MRHSMLVAPSTTPTTLYRLEKNVTQSLSVLCSFSGRSFHSGLTSSALVDVFPRALDASLPANTRGLRMLVMQLGRDGNSVVVERAVVGASWLIGLVPCHIVDLAL